MKYLARCLSPCIRYVDIWLNTIHKKPSLEISKEECRLLPGNRIWRILNPALSHLIRTSMQRKSFCKFKHDCCSRRTIGTRAFFYFTCERWNTRTNGKDMVLKWSEDSHVQVNIIPRKTCSLNTIIDGSQVVEKIDVVSLQATPSTRWYRQTVQNGWSVLTADHRPSNICQAISLFEKVICIFNDCNQRTSKTSTMRTVKYNCGYFHFVPVVKTVASLM